MYAQLDLEVMCKRPSKKELTSNFHALWSEVHCKSYQPKKKKQQTLVFECYNLMDPMEFGAIIF
jgi:hypothetical protein